MTEQHYYGDQAFDSSNILRQSRPRATRIGALSLPLPWGSPQDIVPTSFWSHIRPANLREEEELEQQQTGRSLRREEKFGTAFNHQYIKYAPMSGWTNLWLYMEGIGKFVFYVVTGILFVSFLFLLPVDQSPWVEQLRTTLIMWAWGGGITGGAWLIGFLVLTYVPKKYIYKPSRKGPVWEMNRQTGMVTLFARKKGQFRKYGIEGDFIAPFYEFDATIHTIPDHQGMPWNMLNLLHRYTPVGIDFSVVMGKQRLVEPCMAMWDFWQRYMDISQPLPEIPLLEQYRHLDPATAEHDQRHARPPRFWRDMDEKTFDEKLLEMGNTSAITMNRPDQMWKHRPAG